MHFSYCSRYLITEVRDFHTLEFGGKEGFLAVSCHSFIPPTFMEYLFASGLCVRGREKARMFMIIGGPQKCIHELLCGPGLNDDLHAKCLSAAFPMSLSLGILQRQEARLHSLEPGAAVDADDDDPTKQALW